MIANRITDRQLSILCERVGVAFDVGHDPHKIFKREADSGKIGYAKHMATIAKKVEAGSTLADSLRQLGNYFPADFVQMVEVGERTGRLEKVLDRLGRFYKDSAEVRGEFINSIIWPTIQFLLAIVVVGAMIYVPSIIAPGNEEATDLLGVGLVGARGLKIYLFGVALFFASLALFYFLFRNGFLSPLKQLLARLPWVGNLITVFAEARFVQTLSLALESGLDTWHSVELSFRSASSPLFAAKADSAKVAVRQGRELHVVLSETGLFSRDTLDAVKLGEESGRLAETLDKQFRYLRSEAKSAMTKFAYFASSLVWAAIATILIFIIFRVFSNYIQNIESAGGAIIDRVRSVTPAQ
jgi:type II secretory pathway component PulF